MRLVRSILRRDEGVTLVEVSVAMIGAAIIGTLLVGWFNSVTRTDALHASEDVAVSVTRELENQISRDLRRAMRITAAGSTELSMWIDFDRNGVAATSEVVTWRVSDSGILERVVAGDTAMPATDLALPGTTFHYDSLTLSSISEVTIDFAIPGAGSVRHLRSRITMRNV